MPRYWNGNVANYIDAGDFAASKLAGNFTIFCWVFFDDYLTEQAPIAKYGAGTAQHYLFRIVSNGEMGMFVVDNAGGGHEGRGNPPLRPRVWLPLGGRRISGTEVATWVDGRKGQSPTGVGTDPATASTASFLIGKRNDTSTSQVRGFIAHVAGWSINLSDKEMVALARGTRPDQIQKGYLSFWFPLNENGSNAFDVVNGTLATVNGTLPNIKDDPILFRKAALLNQAVLTRIFAPGQYQDSGTVLIDLQPSSSDLQEFVETATVLVDLDTSGTDVYELGNTDLATIGVVITPDVTAEGIERSDSATVYVDISCSGTDLRESTDTGTAYIDITNVGGECFSRLHLGADGEDSLRWYGSDQELRWVDDAEPRWVAILLGIDADQAC